jgi:hypothetical protein
VKGLVRTADLLVGHNVSFVPQDLDQVAIRGHAGGPSCEISSSRPSSMKNLIESFGLVSYWLDIWARHEGDVGALARRKAIIEISTDRTPVTD